jgi:hypothetical protein
MDNHQFGYTTNFQCGEPGTDVLSTDMNKLKKLEEVMDDLHQCRKVVLYKCIAVDVLGFPQDMWVSCATDVKS